MSREIKFRAWLPEKRDFVYWNLLPSMLSYRSENSHRVFTRDIEERYVQQYTGLKDKNGKEIYEGDIMREPHLGFVSTIEWTDYINGFAGFCNLSAWEVIGNIYENPPEIKKTMKSYKPCPGFKFFETHYSEPEVLEGSEDFFEDEE